MCLHELRTAVAVSCDFRDLPQGAAYPLKACLYQFIEEGLAAAVRHTGSVLLPVRATGGETLQIEIAYETQFPRSSSWLTEDTELSSERVRHQIEALGGTLQVHSPAHGQVRFCVGFGLGDMGNTNV